MKKIFAVLLAVMLLTVCAFAEETQTAWCVLDANVLTVRVPVAEGQSWDYEIFNPDVLEMLTCETTDDGLFVASFTNIQAAEGSTALTLSLTDADGAVLESRAIGLTADESGALTAWYELNANVLTVRVPVAEGQSWNFEISNPAVLEMLTCETTDDGVFVISFTNIQAAEGSAVLALSLTDAENAALEVRTIGLTADETGALTAGEAVVGNPDDNYILFANPLRYDMLLVTDVFVPDGGETLCVQGSFGTMAGFSDEGLVLLGFDAEETFTLGLTEGMTFMMPADLDNPTENVEGEDLLAWFTDASETLGFPATYYAHFEMDEEGTLTKLDYCYIP